MTIRVADNRERWVLERLHTARRPLSARSLVEWYEKIHFGRGDLDVDLELLHGSNGVVAIDVILVAFTDKTSLPQLPA